MTTAAVAIELQAVETAAIETPAIETLIGADRIAERVRGLADELVAILPREIVAVALLKGSFMFAADLVRALHGCSVTCRVDFVTVSSYGDATESSGDVKVRGELPADIAGKAVLLIDDILDTGRTLRWARDALIEAGAGPVATCVLLDKPSRRIVAIEADLVGFTIGDRFVVGYGIDYAQRYRDLPYIGAID